MDALRVRAAFVVKEQTLAEEVPVLQEARDGKLIITLNRPEVLNADNQPLREALVEILDRFESNDDLRVGIICGAGRAFSAGADIKEMRASRAPMHRMMIHFDRVWACNKPIIAAVHGHAAGGGCELAQLCDVRVATADATFSQPELRTIGTIAPIAALHLHRLVPRGEAMLIHLTGRPMSGERAHQIGLVQHLVRNHNELLPAAESIADEMMECQPTALLHAKRLLRANIELQLSQEAVVSALQNKA